MKDPYLYSTLKNTWISIVNREELLSMLNTENLVFAVKTITNKPIGIALYDVVSKNLFNINELSNKLVSFNNERLTGIYNKLSKKEKELINNLNTLFDITNLYFNILLLNNGRRASLIYPIGTFTIYELSGIDSIDSLKKIVPSNLSKLVDLLLSINISDLSNLISIHIKYKLFSRDPLINRIYSFIHDAILIKTCLLTKQLPATGLSILTMYISDFENICSVRELNILPQVLQSINPLYTGFGELMSDLFNLRVSYELLDFGTILYSVNLSSDLIDTLERIVVRTYLLFTAEVMIVRMALTLIDSKIYVEKFRDIVSKWWII